MKSSDATPDALSERATELGETARRVLHGAVSHAFLLLLPLQWLASALLCLFGSSAAVGMGLCRSGLNLWLVLGVSTVVNSVPLAFIRRGPDRPLTRYVIGASQTLFYFLLLGLGDGGFDTRYYVFVSLGFLAFYRDWRLLLAVGGMSLAAECAYDTLVCTSAAAATLTELHRMVSFSIWVTVECGVLVMLCHSTNRVFRSIGLIRAQLEFEREGTHRQLLEQTQQLNQAQKLESVGRLAAGVAHEINTPVQFVNDNCFFLRDAIGQIGAVVRTYREVMAAVADGRMSAQQARERVAAAEAAADLAFVSENMPTAVERALEGLERVAAIVRSMKEFSHPSRGTMESCDINAGIRSTLTVARHEYKYVADVETRLGELPPVVCDLGEFNQTILNILVNAAHAIESVVAGTEQRGLITIGTRQEGETVLISVQDTGGGIPESIQKNIFDPFFTTKEVGKGTGQGLALARSVIVDKHHGSLTFESVPGVGTTFLIRLPLKAMGDAAIAA